MNIPAIAYRTVNLLRENGPIILTAVAVAGVVSTGVLAAKGAPQANENQAEDFKQNGPSATHREVILRTVKNTWRPYLPAMLSGAATIAAVVALHTTHTKRNAALVGLYALTERSFQEYRASVEEVADGKMVEKIKDRVAEKKLEEADPDIRETVDPDMGDVLCYDSFSGRYFKSNTEEIKYAVNKVNHSIINNMYASLNDFYIQLGLDTIRLGEDVGWNSDDLIEIQITSVLTSEGKPAVYLDFETRPYPGYHKFN